PFLSLAELVGRVDVDVRHARQSPRPRAAAQGGMHPNSHWRRHPGRESSSEPDDAETRIVVSVCPMSAMEAGRRPHGGDVKWEPMMPRFRPLRLLVSWFVAGASLYVAAALLPGLRL